MLNKVLTLQKYPIEKPKYLKNTYYSPAAIIRNAKIWNFILLLAFFRPLSSNLDLEYPAASEENC